jgi:hypothetical protein
MMKKIILSLMLLSTVSAFADCTTQYEKAAKNRNIRNSIIIGTASAALMTPFSFTILATAAIPSNLSVAAYFAGIITITNSVPLQLKTNFDKVISAVDAAKSEKDDKSLSKILRMVSRESDVEISDQQASELKTVMVQAFENDVFCPVVKINRKGEEKRAAFTRRAVVKYLSNYLNENLK